MLVGKTIIGGRQYLEINLNPYHVWTDLDLKGAVKP
jgi:hypothetical protein